MSSSQVRCGGNEGQCSWRAVTHRLSRSKDGQGQPRSALWWYEIEVANHNHASSDAEPPPPQLALSPPGASIATEPTTMEPSVGDARHAAAEAGPSSSARDTIDTLSGGVAAGSTSTTRRQRSSLSSSSPAWLRSTGQRPPHSWRPNVQHRPSASTPAHSVPWRKDGESYAAASRSPREALEADLSFPT